MTCTRPVGGTPPSAEGGAAGGAPSGGPGAVRFRHDRAVPRTKVKAMLEAG